MDNVYVHVRSNDQQLKAGHFVFISHGDDKSRCRECVNSFTRHHRFSFVFTVNNRNEKNGSSTLDSCGGSPRERITNPLVPVSSGFIICIPQLCWKPDEKNVLSSI